MSKKLKGIIAASALLVFSAISVTSLTACQHEEEVPDVVDEQEITALSISNKDALTAEYSETDGTRTIELKITSTGSTNAFELIQAGKIKVTSSNEGVATVTGLTITPVNGGTTTITVSTTDGKLKDSVDITIKALDVTKAVPISEIQKMKDGTIITKAQVVATADGGFFVADVNDKNEVSYIYVYYALPGSMKVGKTYYIQSKVSEYGGITQLTSTDFFSKEVPAGEEFNITPDYSTKMDGAALNNLHAKEGQTDLTKKVLSSIVPVTMTLTMYENFDEDKYLWIDKGTDDVTVVYTGYIDPNYLPTAETVFNVNDRYTMTGFLSGTGSHDSFTNRVNFYPVTFKQETSLQVTKLTVKTSKEELRQGESAMLSFDVEEDGAAIKPKYKIVEGKDLVDGSVFENEGSDFLFSNKLKSKKGKAGTIKVAVVDGNDESRMSEAISIAVTDEVYTPVSIESVAKNMNALKGQTALVYGIYTETIKGSETYGVMVEDGIHSLLLYKAEEPEIDVNSYVVVEGTVDVYKNVLQFTHATIESIDSNELTTKPVAPVNVDLSKGKDALSDADTNRKCSFEGQATADVKVDEKYGNLTLDVKQGDITYTMYADSRYVSQANLDKLKAVKAGDTVKLTGRYEYSRNRIQYITEAEVTPAAK